MPKLASDSWKKNESPWREIYGSLEEARPVCVRLKTGNVITGVVRNRPSQRDIDKGRPCFVMIGKIKWLTPSGPQNADRFVSVDLASIEMISLASMCFREYKFGDLDKEFSWLL